MLIKHVPPPALMDAVCPPLIEENMKRKGTLYLSFLFSTSILKAEVQFNGALKLGHVGHFLEWHPLGCLESPTVSILWKLIYNFPLKLNNKQRNYKVAYFKTALLNISLSNTLRSCESYNGY